MFSKTWETSKRQYEPVLERNVAIPVRAGFTIDCTIARPDSNEKFPAIVSMHPFHNEQQFEPMMPRAINPTDRHYRGRAITTSMSDAAMSWSWPIAGEPASQAAPSSIWETA